MHTVLRLIGLSVCILLLGACAGPQRLPPVPEGSPLTLVVGPDASAAGRLSIGNDSIGKDAVTGAGSGMLAGGLSGLSCGPFAFLCVPAGMLVGATAGSVAGGMFGLATGMSNEQVLALRERLQRHRQTYDPVAELRNQLVVRVGKRWRMEDTPPATRMTVQLQELRLGSTRDGRIRFDLMADVTQQPADGSEPSTKTYTFNGPYSELALWMDERSDFLDTSLNSAVQQLASQIVAEMALR
jgi:hypothetical protein